jgi:hypothetical protein
MKTFSTNQWRAKVCDIFCIGFHWEPLGFYVSLFGFGFSCERSER